MNLPAPIEEKISVRKAILYGELFVNLPVIALLLGVPVLFFWLATLIMIPYWGVLASFLLGFVLAWLWWSYATPKWRLWAIRRVDNLYTLHIQAVRGQLVWPHGSIYEHTEIKSPLHVFKEKHVEIHHYFDKFRYYLDFLETTGESFYGLPQTREAVDDFRDALYASGRNPREKGALKVSIDQLRMALMSVRIAYADDEWPALIDALRDVLDNYQGLAKSNP